MNAGYRKVERPYAGYILEMGLRKLGQKLESSTSVWSGHETVMRDIDRVHSGYGLCVLRELEVRCTLAFRTLGRRGGPVDIYGYTPVVVCDW